MKSISYRNASFEAIRAQLSGLRQQVYSAYVSYGPGTTREMAQKSGVSLLTLRPRVTELLQLGFVEVVDGSENSREAIYIAIPVDMVKERFEWLQKQPVQQELPY